MGDGECEERKHGQERNAPSTKPPTPSHLDEGVGRGDEGRDGVRVALARGLDCDASWKTHLRCVFLSEANI